MIALSSALAPNAEVGLRMGIGPAKLWLNGAVITFPATHVFVTLNASTFIYLNTTDGSIGISNVSYPVGVIPITKVVTDQLGIRSFTDDRPDFLNLTAGSQALNFADGEIPAGSGTTLSLSQSPNPPESLILTYNGVTQEQGGDYFLTGSVISASTFTVVGGDIVQAWYRYVSVIPGPANFSFADGEIPVGSGPTFLLQNTPNPARSLILTYNGVIQDQGVDYSLAGRTITQISFTFSAGDILIAWYRF